MSAPPKTVLIIEDDSIVAGVYRSKFEKAGFKAEIAPDGQAGFYRIMELRPSVLMLDLLLPNMNGIDVLKKIRAQNQFRRMPILVLTNSYLSELAMEASQAGASQVFDKATATPDQLVEAANKLLTLPMDRGAASAAPPPAPPASTSQPEPPITGTSPATPAPPAPRSPARSEAILLENSAQSLADLRKTFQNLTRAPEDGARLEALSQLSRKVHSVTSHAAVTGFRNISQFSSALEALLESLRLSPDKINVSTTGTMAASIDFLGELFDKVRAPSVELPLAPNILVLDDEQVPRRNIVRALSIVRLGAVDTDNPELALQLLAERKFELVFLDVEMPVMNGYEVCQKLRQLPAHKQTPVVFVTALSGLQDRARSKLSGGSDFIVKPFLIIELGVKALKHVMQQRLKAPA